MDTMSALYHPSVFSQAVTYNIQSWHPMIGHDVLFYVIFGLLALSAFVRLAYVNEFSEVFTIFKGLTISLQLQRSRSSQLSSVFNWLSIVFTLSVSLFFYLLAVKTSYGRSMPTLWLGGIILAGVILFTVLRTGMQSLIASMFNLKREMAQYLFSAMQVNRVMGLVLIPADLMLAYIKPAWQFPGLLVVIAVLLTMLVYRYYLGYTIGKSRFSGHFFHFLLYICTLEIAPVAIVVKLIAERL